MPEPTTLEEMRELATRRRPDVGEEGKGTLPVLEDPPASRAVREKLGVERVGNVQRLTGFVKLPYPASVYRAAADKADQERKKALGDWSGLNVIGAVCIQEGPHVIGAGCTTMTIGDLLRGVADAVDPLVDKG